MKEINKLMEEILQVVKNEGIGVNLDARFTKHGEVSGFLWDLNEK